jgi:AraC family transcriptional regulator
MSIHVFFFRDIALGFARGLNSNPHAHLALQLTLGLDDVFELQRPNGAGVLASEQVRFACLPPEQLHYMPKTDRELAYLHMDCDSLSYATWRRLGGKPLAPDDALVDDLREFWRSGSHDRQHGFELAQAWRAQSLPGLVRSMPTHPRLANIVEYLDSSPLEASNHVDLARRAHLSPSRFAHVFREQTGMPVRNYVLWRRLVYALTCLQQGQSITTAAHESGFADGAHLCRSFRRVFGATPTDLQVEKFVASVPASSAI